jgi:uncharacterized membrane protein YeaQ/YmgE (transglycosylase-associated protein family)
MYTVYGAPQPESGDKGKAEDVAAGAPVDVRRGTSSRTMPRLVAARKALALRGVTQMPGLESLIILLIVGAIAGWLAGVIVKGYGFGLIGNIVVGIVGAFIGNWLFPQLGFAMDYPIGAIISATLGAVLLLFVIGLIRRVA